MCVYIHVLCVCVRTHTCRYTSNVCACACTSPNLVLGIILITLPLYLWKQGLSIKPRAPQYDFLLGSLFGAPVSTLCNWNYRQAVTPTQHLHELWGSEHLALCFHDKSFTPEPSAQPFSFPFSPFILPLQGLPLHLARKTFFFNMFGPSSLFCFLSSCMLVVSLVFPSFGCLMSF